MPPTETKYTPGAERAALRLAKPALFGDWPKIISEETHDAEMLDSIKESLTLWELCPWTIPVKSDIRDWMQKARELIAKVEGR